MKGELAFGGAVLSALLVGVCCWGPLLLVGLGLTGLGLAAQIAKYRIVFTALTLCLLGLAFFLVYLKREVACEDGTCQMRSGSRGSKIALWLATLVALTLVTTHLWVGVLSPPRIARARPNTMYNSPSPPSIPPIKVGSADAPLHPNEATRKTTLAKPKSRTPRSTKGIGHAGAERSLAPRPGVASSRPPQETTKTSEIIATTPQSTAPSVPPTDQALIFEVSGMDCPGCAVSVKRALEAVPGVRAADVDFDASEATVSLESAHVPPDELVRAIEKLGYRARLKE